MEFLLENKSLKLHYRAGGSSGLDEFADADWVNSEIRRSTTGMMTRYNKGIIYWKSKMQKTVSLSTAEAEYYAASEMAIEVIYLRNLLANMGFLRSPTRRCEWGNHVIGGRERDKHIDIRKHFAHEVNQNQEMRLVKIDTTRQLADIFTKPPPIPTAPEMPPGDTADPGPSQLRAPKGSPGAGLWSMLRRVTTT